MATERHFKKNTKRWEDGLHAKSDIPVTDMEKYHAKILEGPCVYILKCCDGSLYTGWTTDFEKRLKAHSSGKGAKYTRGRLPVLPVYLEYLPDKIAATRREAAIKKMPRLKKEGLITSDCNELSSSFSLSVTE